jgi:hypothetical protein
LHLLVAPLRSVESLSAFRRLAIPIERPVANIQKHTLDVEVLVERLCSALSSNAGMFDSAPWRRGVQAVMIVNPDNTAADFGRDAMRACNVAGADRSSKPVG